MKERESEKQKGRLAANGMRERDEERIRTNGRSRILPILDQPVGPSGWNRCSGKKEGSFSSGVRKRETGGGRISDVRAVEGGFTGAQWG